ncbi:MAG: sulfite exporter TauE/SafE family protein, partial [Candidatus Omnitrophica bacterium]|nr:sulfite exporter TauE/SafE family protein [Candidatus Omnitrophota bacterium]
MISTFVTYLQIFGIGFSFGLAGPCFLTCTPVLITYIAGSKRLWTEVYIDILTFLSGRLLAYILLGALAGLSGAVLKKFTGSSLSLYFQPLAGAVTILFAVILFMDKSSD